MVGCLLAGAGSLVVASLVVGTARISYFLPPAFGETEGTRHETWNMPVLALVPVAGLALLIAVVGLALGILGLARRRGVHGAVLILPGASLVVSTLALAIAATIDIPTF